MPDISIKINWKEQFKIKRQKLYTSRFRSTLHYTAGSQTQTESVDNRHALRRLRSSTLLGWASSKLIRVFAPRSHNIGNLVQEEHPKNSGGIGVG